MVVKGHYQMARFGSVIWAKSVGPCSDRVVSNYCAEMQNLAQQTYLTPWIRVNDIRDWQPATPRGMQMLGELMDWCERNNLQHSINIMSNESLQTFVLDQMMADVSRQSIRHVTQNEQQVFSLLQSLPIDIDCGAVIQRFYPKG